MEANEELSIEKHILATNFMEFLGRHVYIFFVSIVLLRFIECYRIVFWKLPIPTLFFCYPTSFLFVILSRKKKVFSWEGNNHDHIINFIFDAHTITTVIQSRNLTTPFDS